MNVSLFIAGRADRQTVELPEGATVLQLKARVTNLGQWVFKSLTSASVETLTDESVLTDGMALSFSPTEQRTSGDGSTTYTTKKIAGANDVVMTPVKLVRQEVFLETTIPSVLTVADVLKQAWVISGCVYINGEEVWFSKKIGDQPVTIEVRDCPSEVDEEDDDEDEEDNW